MSRRSSVWLSTAPGSTRRPSGRRRLTADIFSETTERGELAYSVDGASWLDTLETEFGLTLEE